ncbi:hypothetical protein N7510_003672 [Penicillium lagena]|uniref:uncharacterized protein n=1 Tax=Penicillium lagena TaxID=94218 RepID=UPI002541E3AB|nr:uncharacterized protein N7510_003672 [Penicillium lagena]KAJ5619688.1 hypothetical protein N7510_003672 [Penicillium lagena]
MASRAWADEPWPLIETPSKTQDVSTHAAIYIANEMACTHNCMLRGLNSIYLQAEQVERPADIGDFLTFIKFWANWVSDHHVLEEEHMFPGFEKAIGITGFLGNNVEQHHAFQSQLKDLLTYGASTKPASYDASVLREIIERMAPIFHQHLSNEIDSLLSMQPYNGEALLKVYKQCVASAAKQEKQVVPPMVLGLRDVTFEGGSQWPALPPLAEWVINYLFARRHAGAWRFLPCDMWGKPRPLAFGPTQGE